MSRTPKAEGTKIAQAAKDLNVTSVTIRRYIAEFGIETTSDENGIKVLPNQAMEELKEIRRLKEEGLTNPKVMEILEDSRKQKPADKAETKAKGRTKKVAAEPVRARQEEEEAEPEQEEAPAEKRKTARRVSKVDKEVEPEEAESTEESDMDQEDGGAEGDGGAGEGKSKHSLTCQTCGKVFEHMNPRLRDCLECYRTKRKERRRGGADRHKNVIQHPLAQQAASKSPQQTTASAPAAPVERAPRETAAPHPVQHERPQHQYQQPVYTAPLVQHRTAVRNYRKAIEETRQITGSLKRRLERPDLPEGERRWLEQIYAYQLILHQGWRHLAEYKAASQAKATGGTPQPLNLDD